MVDQSNSAYTSTSQQHSSDARNTSSGPVSAYSAYSAADPSAMMSQQGYPLTSSSHTHSGNVAMTPVAAGTVGASPFYTPMPTSTPAYGSTGYPPSQPGSTGYPPSSVMGGGPFMSSSGAGMQGMQPTFTSSNAPSSMPGQHPYSNSGSQGMNGVYTNSLMPPNAASYPAMVPVGSQPLPPHGPLSSMGPIPMGPMMSSGMDPAAAQAEAARLADAAALDVGAYGDRGTLIHFRPKLGDKLVCTCPMVCLVNASRGAGSALGPHAVPLHTTMLQYSVQCHISQAFVDLLLVVQYPNVSDVGEGAALGVFAEALQLSVAVKGLITVNTAHCCKVLLMCKSLLSLQP